MTSNTFLQGVILKPALIHHQILQLFCINDISGSQPKIGNVILHPDGYMA